MRREILQRGDHRLLVDARRQVVRLHRRRDSRVGRLDPEPAAAFRPARDRDQRSRPGTGASAAPGLSKLPARNWYCTSGEARPSRVFANSPIGAAPIISGAAPPEDVFEAGLRLAQPAARDLVERVGVARLVDDAAAEMVLQVFADPGERVHDRDAMLAAAVRGRADPRQLQQLRRLQRAAGEQHLAPRAAPAAPRRPGGIRARPRACRRTARDGQRADLDPEVGALHRRAQIGDRGAARGASCARSAGSCRRPPARRR